MEQTKEAVYLINDAKYLHLRENGTGVGFATYNKVTGEPLESGQISEKNLPPDGQNIIPAARNWYLFELSNDDRKAMPVFREEPLAIVRELYEEQDMMEPPLPDYKVGDNVIVDLPTRTIEGTIGYVGETDVRIDTSAHGQSWDNEVINKRQFEDGLRQNEQVTTQPDDTVKTVAIYPAEENRMPYDIVIQTIGSKSPTLDAVEPEQSTLELAGNFHITDDDLGVGGPKQKFARNIEAIRTLFKLEEEHRGATAEEQQVLSQYVGWGGLADAFDPGKDNWAKEYAELKGLLSEDEYAAARSSTLNAHYTSPTVIRSIYDAVERMGFHNGNILEPSMGVGNFFGMLPNTMQDSRLYGVELDSITGRIAKKLYPQADITVAGFETIGYLWTRARTTRTYIFTPRCAMLLAFLPPKHRSPAICSASVVIWMK